MRHFKATKTVEAVELDSSRLHSKMPGWFFDAYKEGEIRYSISHHYWTIQTPNGPIVPKDGDFVIQDTNGSLYTCSYETLKETFKLEEVQDE